MTLRLVRARAAAGRASKPGRLEKKGASTSRPRDQETTNPYNDTYDVNSLVLELAFDIKNRDCLARPAGGSQLGTA